MQGLFCGNWISGFLIMWKNSKISIQTKPERRIGWEKEEEDYEGMKKPAGYY